MVVNVLALQLVAADGNLLCVDDDNEVTTVDVRRVGGLVLATQQVRCLNGKTAEHHVSGVDDVHVWVTSPAFGVYVDTDLPRLNSFHC